jgi:deoxyhypusine synthase
MKFLIGASMKSKNNSSMSDAHKQKKHINGSNYSKANGFFSNSFSKFERLEALDLGSIRDFDGFARALSKTAFGGRSLGEAADVLHEMASDKSCFKVLTLSGAMTMAKMGLLVCDMIDKGMADAVVSTGALISHGLIESMGMTHFKDPGNISDEALRQMRLDRIYDTLELDDNLGNMGSIIEEVLEETDPKNPVSSYQINNRIGERLAKTSGERGILKCAFLKKVPVYIPAFTDSVIGLHFAIINRKRKLEKKPAIMFDPFLDLEHYANLVFKSGSTGIFTVGGGVPRNWAQQVAPYLDWIRYKFIDNSDPSKYIIKDKSNPYLKQFKYAVRICPEPVHWGGLSGCTYSEGISWGKFVPKNEGGRFAEVYADATIAWPIILKAAMERLGKNGKMPQRLFEKEMKAAKNGIKSLI